MTIKERRRMTSFGAHGKNGILQTKRLVRMVVPLTLKASADPTERTFEGFAATWDQDLGQDTIKRGAFKDTLKEWKRGGDALPLLDSHDQFSIMSAYGQLIDAQETSKGLWTKWEVIDGSEGDAVLARLRPMKLSKRPIIGKMSIGFFPEEFTYIQPKGTTDPWDRIRNLTKVSLKEVSLVLFPMNPNASIDASSVKSFALSMENTESGEIDMLTKKELRKLAGLIGSALKKKPKTPADDAAEEADPADATDPNEAEEDAPKKPAKKPKKAKKKDKTAPTTPSRKTDLEEMDKDDDDEDDDDLEEVDIDEEDDLDDDDDDAVDDETDEDESDEESDDTDEEDESTEDEPKTKTATGTPIYSYGEALAQRIARLNLSQRMEDLTSNQ